MRRSSILRARAVVLIIAALFTAGCASSVATSPDREKASAYESPRFLLPSPAGPISASVTTGNPPDVPEHSGKEWLTLMLGGLALAPLGIIAPPLYASAIVVGGALVATTSAAGYGTEAVTYGRAGRAIKNANLPALLCETLQARSVEDCAQSAAGQLIVAVPAWGMVGIFGTKEDMHCLVAAVELTITLPNRPAIAEQIRLTLDPTEGLPPVQCASLSRFNEDGGRLIRETARDYAELLAELITDRVKRLE